MKIRVETSVFDDNLLQSSIEQTAESIRLEVRTGYYTKTEIDQTSTSITALITDESNARKTIIRAQSGGVITACVGQTYGVYTNAVNGSVDIVSLSWNINTPSVASTLASYGTTITLGKVANSTVRSVISSSSMTIISRSSSGVDSTIASFGSSIVLASNGAAVTIGSTSSYNTYIDSNGMKIRYNGNEQASFGTNTIDLGVASETSTINLCGNKYFIKGSKYNYTTSGAEIIGIGASGTATLKGVSITTMTSSEFSSFNSNSGTLPTYSFAHMMLTKASNSYSTVNIMSIGSTNKTIGSYTGRLGSSILITPSSILLNPAGAFNSLDFATTPVEIGWSGDDTSYLKAHGKLGTVFGKDNPTGSANCHITTAGYIYMASSSSRRYKRDISNIQDDNLNPERLYDLPVSQFRYNEGYIYIEEGETYDYPLIPGFIAEDVYEIYPAAAEFSKGEVESWDVKMIVPPMLYLIQKHKKTIDELKKRIATLEKMIA